MSIETLLAANIKATEALTEALTALVPALGAVKTTKAAKDKPATTSAADPAATSAAPAGAAAGSAAASGTQPGSANAAPAQLDPQDPFSIAVTAFARTHGREAAHAFIKKFGGEGRASTIKEIDRPAAFEFVKKEHVRLDAVKAAAAAPKQDDSLI
jgi:hypothetical protein